MTKYLRSASRGFKTVPQSEKADERQVPNSAGGYAFPVDNWTRLDRFLILGSEGGSYYASEQKLTKENANAVLACIFLDGKRTVDRIVEVSHSGRAPKNDPALFALALAASSPNANTRAYALAQLDRVARISTHLFHFAEYVNSLRGWGRGLRNAVGLWYTGKDLAELQNQLVKYQQRDGWSHADLLRLAHPKGSAEQDAAFRWSLGEAIGEARKVQKWAKGDKKHAQTFSYKGVERRIHLPLIEAFEAAKTASTRELLAIIRENGLTREMVPTEALKDARVWEALLEKMPMTAMIRNLANMTRCGLLAPMSAAAKTVAERLGERELLRKARIHPIQIITALRTYASGHGVRSHGEGWTPVQGVVDALDDAFYMTFDNVEPTGKRWFIGLDVSGSMSHGNVAGVPDFPPSQAAAVMCMVTARTEKEHAIYGFGDHLRSINISPRERLDSILKKTENVNFGGTNCALPMTYAKEKKMDIDAFAVYTDNETWSGHIHPHKALQDYREARGIQAKEIVVGLVSNGFTIADPNDGGMLDVVGFDMAAPAVMADFIRG